jgi:hypothetical protein
MKGGEVERMLAKNVLTMVSALNYKDVGELKSMLTPKGLLPKLDLYNSLYGTEELEAKFTPDEIMAFERSNEWRQHVVGQFEQALDKLEGFIEVLLTSGRGVDRPIYDKALLKLRELQTALRDD